MQRYAKVSWALTGLVLSLAVEAPIVGGPPKPPAKPAEIAMDVTPQTVAPGGDVRVRVRVEPIAGVKINRYPRVELKVPPREGLVAGGSVSVGSDTPPEPEDLGTNFFKELELELPLTLDAEAPAGLHELGGKLTYFYCLTREFCARKSVDVIIPLTVR